MAYAISLWFESLAEVPIQGLWRQLHEAGLASFLWEGNFRPHVTLGIYEELDVEPFAAMLGGLLKEQVPIEITLAYIGCFSGGRQSVSGHAAFLAVTPTERLLALHRKVHNLLSDYATSPRPYYLPGRWNPHCTIAREFPFERLSQIIENGASFELPLTVRVESIGIIDTPLEIELKRCPFFGVI